MHAWIEPDSIAGVIWVGLQSAPLSNNSVEKDRLGFNVFKLQWVHWNHKHLTFFAHIFYGYPVGPFHPGKKISVFLPSKIRNTNRYCLYGERSLCNHSSSVLTVNNLPVSLQIPLKLFADHPELRPWRARLVYSADIITMHPFKSGSDNFSNECRYTKPKCLLCPITKDWKPVGPIKTRITLHVAVTKSGKKVRVQVMIGFGVSSDWLRNWREFFKPIKKLNTPHVLSLSILISVF